VRQVGDSLHGAGTYAIEAGPGGTFQVRGSYARPEVTLEFTYDQGRGGLRQVFSGHAESFGMKVLSMVGTLQGPPSRRRSPGVDQLPVC
jgi:hypothetical protein